MKREEIMQILKIDIGISEGTKAYDLYLNSLVGLAEVAITKEGIQLVDSVEDGMLVEMYAAYLYRKRREGTAMPRQLRWMLNNKLFAQKAKGDQEVEGN